MKTALLVVDLQRYFLEVGHADKLARVGTVIANQYGLRICLDMPEMKEAQ